MPDRSVALVGVAGGVGTTRLTLEVGAALARAGDDVLLLDAAFATQGLSRHVPGSLDPDLTAVLTGDCRLEDATYPLDVDTPGRLDASPVHAAFVSMTDALTATAGERFASLVETDGYDAVLVDTPPLASNPAVAAVTSADVVAAVRPDSPRGVDALQRTRGRVADVGAAIDHVIVNRADAADFHVPEAADPAPAVLDASGSAFAAAIVDVAATLFSRDMEHEEPGLLERVTGALGQ